MAEINLRADLIARLEAHARQTGRSLDEVVAAFLDSALPSQTKQTPVQNPVSEAVLIARADGTLVFASPNVAHVFGVSAADLMALGNLKRVFDSPVEPDSESGPVECRFTNASGESHTIWVRAEPVHLEPGTRLYNCQSSDHFENILNELRQMRRAVEQNPSTIVVTDPDGNITYVNPKFTQLTGYSAEEVIGQNPRILQSGHTPPEEYVQLWKTITSGHTWHGEFLNKKKNGELYWEMVSISPIFDDRGEITHFVAIKEEITERKAAEKALRESEARYQALFDRNRDAVFLVGLDRRLIQVNQRAAEMLGYTVEELVGKPMSDFVAPGEGPQSLVRTEQLLANETIPIYERRLRRKDGSILVGEVNAALAHDLDGNPSHFQSIVRDVTDRERIDLALRTSEARFRAIIRAIPDMILRVRSDYHVVEFISGQEGDVTPLPAPIPVPEMLLPEAAEMLMQATEAALRTREAQIRGYELKEADAPILYEEARVVADSQDTVLAIIRDITPYKKTEVALAEREQTAREFQDYLKQLNQINIELARAETEDELCYQAIALGCESLGFDRLLIAVREGDTLRVAYGLDRNGQVQDKRHIQFQQRQLDEWQAVLQQPGHVLLWQNVPLADFNQVLGHGWYAMAVLKQGDHVLGALTIDNLRYQRAPRSYETELLALYAASLGNLILRKRAEAQLRLSEQTAREFQEYLKQLHTAHMELARAENLDMLCRRVIEVGLERLGFDRLGLMLIDEPHKMLIGTYGTDQDGQVRDEHDYQASLLDEKAWVNRIFEDAGYAVISERASLQDYDTEVGRGWNGVTAVWDGVRTVGVLFVDNLRYHRPPRVYEADLLALYGSVIGHLIIQKQAEDVLRASENRFRTLLEAAPVGVLLVSEQGMILSSNRTAEQLFGYSNQEIVGLHVEDLMPENYRDAHLTHRGEFFETPRQRIMGIGMELFGLKKDGRKFPIEVALSFIEFEGEPVGIAFIADSTERKQLERQRLELALERERTGILAQFMRDAAHEFRTPLSIINTELFLMERAKDPERQRELRNRIQRESDSLTELVDALTTMLRLDSGTFDHLTRVDLSGVIRAVVTRMQQTVDAKAITMEAHLAMPPLYVQGESGDLALAFTSILDNAVRFTAEGGHIWVTWKTEADQLIVSIRDDGIGMTPEVQDRIFERFYRADDAHTTRGFGLGLPIARRIIEYHGGHVAVESEPGQGSTFHVTLPLSEPIISL